MDIRKLFGKKQGRPPKCRCMVNIRKEIGKYITPSENVYGTDLCNASVDIDECGKF